MKNKKTNLILFVSIALLLLFSFAFVYLLDVIKNKNKHISAVSVTLGEKIAERENIGILEKKMTELLDTQKKVSEYFVDTSNISGFVEYLEGIGNSNNTELSVKSVDFVKNDKTKVLVSVSINGHFAETIKTIAVLENSPYSITINSLYLNKDITPTGEAPTTDPKKKEVVKTVKPSWQADITFSVLNL